MIEPSRRVQDPAGPSVTWAPRDPQEPLSESPPYPSSTGALGTDPVRWWPRWGRGMGGFFLSLGKIYNFCFFFFFTFFFFPFF